MSVVFQTWKLKVFCSIKDRLTLNLRYHTNVLVQCVVLAMSGRGGGGGGGQKVCDPAIKSQTDEAVGRKLKPISQKSSQK